MGARKSKEMQVIFLQFIWFSLLLFGGNSRSGCIRGSRGRRLGPDGPLRRGGAHQRRQPGERPEHKSGAAGQALVGAGRSGCTRRPACRKPTPRARPRRWRTRTRSRSPGGRANVARIGRRRDGACRRGRPPRTTRRRTAPRGRGATSASSIVGDPLERIAVKNPARRVRARREPRGRLEAEVEFHQALA